MAKSRPPLLPQMTIDLSTLAQDEAAITAELPATLVFGDQEVEGMSGPDMTGQRLTDEGFMGVQDIEFRTLISRFKTNPATAPFLNQAFTHKETGKQYRIKTVQTDTPVNLSFILTCVDITR